MPKTAIVVPCYNESDRLNVSAFQDFVKQYPDFFFCFVNDGSSDNTLEVITHLSEKSAGLLGYLNLEKNEGKAEAVRQGIMYLYAKNEFDWIGFLDADLATPLDELLHLAEQTKNGNFIAIMGVRLQRLGANINRKTSRHYFGRIFSTFASIILKLPVYDTQCGAKLFHQSVIESSFSSKFLTKWIFDIEIIARIRNANGRDVCKQIISEVPLNTWLETGGSKLQLKHFLKIPFDLWRVNVFYN